MQPSAGCSPGTTKAPVQSSELLGKEQAAAASLPRAWFMDLAQVITVTMSDSKATA